jgi:16S rRNA (uracil1498-N3)-methyltransferase
MIRLFVTPALAPDALIAPEPEQARYLTQVMRLKAGDPLLLFNGRDGEWRAEMAEVLKRGCVLRAREQVRPQSGVPEVELVMATIRRARLESVIEKATELGVRRIRLVTTRRTGPERPRMERLRAIAVEAAEQTERLDVPEIDAPAPLSALLDGWTAPHSPMHLMVCDERGGPPVLEALGAHTPAGAPWAIVIGPEGGFDPLERDALLALHGAVPVSLGPRVLRADTAAMVALGLWQGMLGDWGEARVPHWSGAPS